MVERIQWYLCNLLYTEAYTYTVFSLLKFIVNATLRSHSAKEKTEKSYA